MNKYFRQIGFIALAVILGFSIAGCGDPTDNLGTDTVKTALGTPANVKVVPSDTALTLAWDAVQGADSYTVEIDGNLFNRSVTNYDLINLALNPKEYQIKVRAVAANGDSKYKDSDWSSPVKCEPAEYIFTFGGDTSQNVRSAAGRETITGLTKFGKTLNTIVIPEKVGSVTITTIGESAFADNKSIQSISLPETIITIQANAFSGTDISNIVIPESVISIGDGAFANCIVLVVIVFVNPASLDLGDNVFEGCEQIESIVVPAEVKDAFTAKITESTPELADIIDEIVTSVTVTGIAVTKSPAKITYLTGETLDTSGIEVTATMSDKSTQVISSGLSFNPTKLDTVGTITITVSYIDLSAEFTVTVTAPPSGGPDPALNGTWISKVYRETNSPTQFVPCSKHGQGTSGNAGSDDGGKAEDCPDCKFIYEETEINEYELELVLNNGNWEWKEDGEAIRKGTYTASGGNMTFTTTLCVIGGSEEVDSDNPSAVKSTTIWGTRDEAMKILMEDIGFSREEAEEYLNSMYFISGIGTYSAASLTLTGYGEVMAELYGESMVFTRGTSSGQSYKVNINYTPEQGGGITVNPQGSIAAGTNVTIVVSINQGFTLGSLNVTNASNGNSINHRPLSGSASGSNTYTFTMPASAVTISAVFTSTGTPEQSYTVIFDADGGAFPAGVAGVSNDGSKIILQAAAGQIIQSSRVPNPTRQGYSFDCWMSSANDGKGGNLYFYLGESLITSDMNIFAVWKTSGNGGATYSISAPSGMTGGSITTDPKGSAAAGAAVTVYVSANPGYEFDVNNFKVINTSSGASVNWNNQTTGSAGGYTFTMPAANVTISGSFTPVNPGSGTENDPFKLGDNKRMSGVLSGSTAELWYSFSVTAGTRYYVNLYDSTGSNYYMATYSNGTIITDKPSYEGRHDINVSADGIIKVKVYPSSNPINADGFEIGYNTTGAPIAAYYLTSSSYFTGGTLNTSHSGYIIEGTTVTITATAETGYAFDPSNLSITSNGVTITYQANGTGGYTFVMPASAVSISGIEFKETGTFYDITMNPGANGSIYTQPYGRAVVGASVSVNVYGDEDYKYTESSLEIKDSSGKNVAYQQEHSSGFTFTMPASNVTITAKFEASIRVSYENVTANGSQTQTTTQLTFTLSKAVPGLTAADITLSNNDNRSITKGTLSNVGAVYTLPITIEKDPNYPYMADKWSGQVMINITKQGYDISYGTYYTNCYFYYYNIPAGFQGKEYRFMAQNGSPGVGANGETKAKFSSTGPVLTIYNADDEVVHTFNDIRIDSTGDTVLYGASVLHGYWVYIYSENVKIGIMFGYRKYDCSSPADVELYLGTRVDTFVDYVVKDLKVADYEKYLDTSDMVSAVNGEFDPVN